MRNLQLSRFWRRTTVYIAFALVLTWLVVSRSLAAYLADVAPLSALWLNPSQSQALVNLADSALNGAVKATEP